MQLSARVCPTSGGSDTSLPLSTAECPGTTEQGSGGEDDTMALHKGQMAAQSVLLRRAAKSLTRLRLSWPSSATLAVRILIVSKEPFREATSVEADTFRRDMAEAVAKVHKMCTSAIGRTAIVFVCDRLEPFLSHYAREDPTIGYWSCESLPDLDSIDLCITLGGDGTVLSAAWLFQSVVPPILTLHMGSLGFLTLFDAESAADSLRSTVSGSPPRVLLRMRLQCRVEDASGRAVCDWHVLNEVSIERGPSPHMALLEVSSGEQFLTAALADGIVIATPTGSTAYSLSGGGPIVHPDVPCILVTPICPHTLSFRPLCLPETSCVRIRLAPASRAERAWVSFDGRERMLIERGWQVQVAASPYPVPTVCRRETQTFDWFAGLSHCFRWNSRSN